ncbi:MAG: hypothetical protein HRT45_11510 [Bdellovibrionales bacterium]|nr:hypothetical protein [Bdellovibrionales bacterium]
MIKRIFLILTFLSLTSLLRAERPYAYDGQWIDYSCHTQSASFEQDSLFEDAPSFLLTGQEIDQQLDLWPKAMWHKLTYCVSERFRGQRDKVIQAFEIAAKDWMEVANVTFSYVEAKDCSPGSEEVLFSIVPVGRRARFSMRAFFPSYAPEKRRIQANTGKLKRSLERVTGVFRHEIGHILGFRHEQMHPDANVDREICPEESTPAVAITEYDIYSVMLYPICGGKSGFYSKLSELDSKGAALLYPFE